MRSRTTRGARTAAPVGLLLMLLGAWAFVVPLVGPYFDFGFFTDRTWSFSTRHLELLLLPGALIFAGGLLVAMPSRGARGLGALLAFAGGAWLLVGPSLYPLWASEVRPTQHDRQMTGLLWIGYFYGTGALTMFLAGVASGLPRRPVVADEMPVIEETPAERAAPEDRVVTRT
jgi:hypothetical protein